MKQKIFILIGLFTTCLGMAQIGVGTENPTNGIEIEGSVRFRNLEEGDLKVFNREVLMDKEGNLGYQDIESDRSYFVKMVSNQMKEQVIVDKTDQSKDLQLEVELELLPNTISVFEIHYNVPFSFEVVSDGRYRDLPLVNEVGARLMKKEEGKDSAYVNVREGNRALSIVSEYENTYPRLNSRRSFVEGMTIQEVVNTSTSTKKITYKMMSYSKANEGLLKFNSDNGEGIGMILVKVYHKPYYGETTKK
ncbi:hypothetical protein HX071_07170 [Myroides marinus]|uniref:hypothetical protein n=1 Tax=Myroides marinus TaxID=703342 RepID=UPI0025779052|nr:hypothetical protein [Myroides marinus]MDM1501982.1 hypothetical protein [Myroides marinus]